MTEKEKLEIVRDYMRDVDCNEPALNTYQKACFRIGQIWAEENGVISGTSREIAELKNRAERAELEAAELKRSLDVSGFASEQARKRVAELEAALSEAQDRALRFEKLLKAEEARKEAEPVLERNRVLETARQIIGKTRNDLYGTSDYNTFETDGYTHMIHLLNSLIAKEGWADDRTDEKGKSYQWK